MKIMNNQHTENSKEIKGFKSSKNWKDNFLKMIVAIFILTAIISGIVWLYNHSNLKDRCQRQVQYVPAKGATDGIFASPSEDAHFSWMGEKFESREASIESCIRYEK